jgi:hypothetical protein
VTPLTATTAAALATIAATRPAAIGRTLKTVSALHRHGADHRRGRYRHFPPGCQAGQLMGLQAVSQPTRTLVVSVCARATAASLLIELGPPPKAKFVPWSGPGACVPATKNRFAAWPLISTS